MYIDQKSEVRGSFVQKDMKCRYIPSVGFNDRVILAEERAMDKFRTPKQAIKSILRPIRFRWTTEKTLKALFALAKLQDYPCVLFHTAMSPLGFVPRGEKTIVSLMQHLAQEVSCVSVPTHTWQWVEENTLRVFDSRKTPSCVGAIPEWFRTTAGVVRSLHPTHSVAAIGIAAEQFTIGHNKCSTPCGHDTPYHRLLVSGGAIAFLGVGLESNTCFHTMEAIANVPYLLNEGFDEFVITDHVGFSARQSFKRHRPQVARRFAQLEDVLVAQGIARRNRFRDIDCITLDGASFHDFMSDCLMHDPLFLLANEERRNWE